MIQKWSVIIGVFAAAALLLSLSSCARDQELLSISIPPTTETFGATHLAVRADAA
jgi:hypothetical protein